MPRELSYIQQYIRRNVRLATKPVGQIRAVTLGGRRHVDEYRHAIAIAGMIITDDANRLLDQIVLEGEPCDYDVMFLRNADLGVDEAGLGTTYRAAKRKNLYLSPLEMPLALRLAYRDQPERERLMVATKSVISPFNRQHLRFFLTMIEGQPILGFHFGSEAHAKYRYDSLHAFMKPRYLKNV